MDSSTSGSVTTSESTTTSSGSTTTSGSTSTTTKSDSDGQSSDSTTGTAVLINEKSMAGGGLTLAQQIAENERQMYERSHQYQQEIEDEVCGGRERVIIQKMK